MRITAGRKKNITEMQTQPTKYSQPPQLDETNGLFLFHARNLPLVRGEQIFRIHHWQYTFIITVFCVTGLVLCGLTMHFSTLDSSVHSRSAGIIGMSIIRPRSESESLIVSGLGLMSLVALYGIGWWVRRYRKAKELQQQYLIIRGTIVAVRWHRTLWNSLQSSHAELKLQFVNPRGQQITTKFIPAPTSSIQRPTVQVGFTSQPLPAPGTSIAVLYHSDDNYRLL